MIYFLLFLYIFFLIFISIDKRFQKYNYFIFGISIAALFLFAAFRFEVGQDYDNYLDFFNKVVPINEFDFQDLDFTIEIGYQLLEAVVKYFCNNFNVMIIVMTTTIFLLFINLIRKYSVAPLISLLIFVDYFYLIQVMGQYRQVLSLLMCLNALCFVEDRKFFRFLIVVAFASAFHTASIIFLCVYFVPRIKFTNKKLCFFIMFGFIILAGSLFLKTILIFIIKLLDFGIVGEKVQLYLNETSISFITIPGICEKLILFLFLFLVNKKPLNQKHIGVYVLGFYWYLFFMPINSTLSARGALVFLSINLLLAAEVYKELTFKRKVLFMIAYIGAGVYLIAQELLTYAHIYLPYRVI